MVGVSRAGDGSYSMALERQITLPAGDVFEGIAPMFIKGGAEIVTTVASSLTGAWLRTYDVFCGNVVSESSSIGWGWRHMLFYNNFAPTIASGDALYSLVEVLTPHDLYLYLLSLVIFCGNVSAATATRLLLQPAER